MNIRRKNTGLAKGNDISFNCPFKKGIRSSFDHAVISKVGDHPALDAAVRPALYSG